MNYKIYKSGSQGNLSVINNVIVDFGVSLKEFKSLINLEGIKYALITHKHRDHLNFPVLKYLIKNNIKVYSNYETYDYIINNASFKREFIFGLSIFEPGDYLMLDGFMIKAYAGIHDVDVNIYEFTDTNENLIYATDTKSFINVPNIKYDYLLIEFNYDNENINIEEHKNSARHSSIINSQMFCNDHKKENSVIVKLHESRRFF